MEPGLRALSQSVKYAGRRMVETGDIDGALHVRAILAEHGFSGTDTPVVPDAYQEYLARRQQSSRPSRWDEIRFWILAAAFVMWIPWALVFFIVGYLFFEEHPKPRASRHLRRRPS